MADIIEGVLGARSPKKFLPARDVVYLQYLAEETGGAPRGVPPKPEPTEVPMVPRSKTPACPRINQRLSNLYRQPGSSSSVHQIAL